MTSTTKEERLAGTLILSQFKMFNEAVVVFETQIEPAFWQGFDQCIQRFIKDNGWEGEVGIVQKGFSWLAPTAWKSEDDDWKYWFETHIAGGDGADYRLATIAGLGTEGAEFGFCFEIRPRRFGGAKKLGAYLNARDPQCREQLIGMDFEDLTKGNYYLPVTVDINLVTECWQEYGEFPDDHEVFNNLSAALDTLREAIFIFDEMFSAFAESDE
ncbi:hypothetical protein J5069_21620 [Candidatus Symbiopectobacterium sp. NZEC127]|uniref:hypothetical protein n=1 Tax=Candidatus Symbiopectobacterium sp. NZEC127 TaxID=2820472 RepID=UPI002226A976|nr:hypothetical protein [Candidatus Symbiopectobacterium sp. NZEC127]MCW2488507.1 hypothetical protein [Candidatus Symbiopectobacterium sp. NZEC127]